VRLRVRGRRAVPVSIWKLRTRLRVRALSSCQAALASRSLVGMASKATWLLSSARLLPEGSPRPTLRALPPQPRASYPKGRSEAEEARSASATPEQRLPTTYTKPGRALLGSLVGAS